MSDNAQVIVAAGNPYKIVDHARERRKGITASSLKELTNVARNRLALPTEADLTIVLEQDGKIIHLNFHFSISYFPCNQTKILLIKNSKMKFESF